MFCDLANSTALSTKLDPEEMSNILRSYQQCCTEQVVRAGGLVAKYMGDGILIYFGYPQAHEDDAERAVRAALAIGEAVRRLPSPADMALQVRTGIATGLVVVGEVIGEGVSQELAVVGQTPNLAARLQSIADPGKIIIGMNTRLLVGGLFDCRDLGMLHLKGFDEPVRAWRVEGESRTVNRFEALRATTTPLVGRSEEIDLMMRRWEAAKSGAGAVVLISGEPGIGKSRLAQSLLDRLSGEPHTRLRYFCSPHQQDRALWPAITQFEHAAGFRHDDTGEQKLGKLEALLSLSTDDLAETIPVVANLLSVPTGDRYRALDLTPQKHKETALRTVLAQIEQLAALRPLLIFYEDIHWSDSTTLELLDLLVERTAALRALVILTFRPEFKPAWAGRPHVSLLSLNRLLQAQRTEMIFKVTGGKILPPEITEQITDRTDGVPLFIEELTKSVIESGLLSDSGDRYSLTGPVPSMAIPTSLQASLLARLDRLGSSREVLQIAAAIGRHFSHELIGAVAALPAHQLDHALKQLIQAELIYRRAAPNGEYSFKHALVRDTVDSTLLRQQRQRLNAKIAAVLETQFPEIAASQPDRLARHYDDAKLPAKAVGFWLEAGRQALRRSAMAEAVVQLQKGLDALAGVPGEPSHRQQELDLLTALAQALSYTKGYAATEVGTTLTRARSLAQQLERPDYLVRLSVGQYAFHMFRSELASALRLAEQTEQIGVARHDLRVQLGAARLNGQARVYLGEFAAARALFERCLSDAGPELAGASGPNALHVMVLANLSVALAHLGYIDQARSRLQGALSEARRLRKVDALADVLAFALWIEKVTESSELEAHADELLSIANEHGFPLHSGWATAHLGWASVRRGQDRAGRILIERGLAAIRATGTVAGPPGALSALLMLAETYALAKQPIEGLARLAEAAEIIEATGQRYRQAELSCFKADLLTAMGNPAGAERSYQAAIEIAQAQSAKLLELRASIGLARLWQEQGKQAAAYGLLRPIYEWFTEGLDALDLEAARVLLDGIAASSGSPIRLCLAEKD